MKKIFISFLLALASITGLQALCVTRTMDAEVDGEYFGRLSLRRNCTFFLSTVDGESFRGTYYIDSDEGLQSGSTYTIVFNVSDGRTIRSVYMCPVYGKECVNLDGYLFEAQ